jgi:pimeloyl-ACP methyl ester carboxylesterase
MSPPPGRIATVNGLDVYYEMHGKGDAPPLVLLHGGVGGIEMFGPNLPALAAGRRVIAVDLQGHGHTGDVDRPLRFESMADDLVALLHQLGAGPADVMGYSLGGGVALQAAIRHPAAVRRLVLVSAAFRRAGWFPEVLAAFDRMGPAFGAGMAHSPLAALYPGKDWAALFTKLGDLLRRDYDWSSDVAALRAPTLLVYADADAVQPAHAVDFFRLLGGGLRDAGLDGSGRPASRLAVIPGATHYDVLATSRVAEMVGAFLEKEVG